MKMMTLKIYILDVLSLFLVSSYIAKMLLSSVTKMSRFSFILIFVYNLKSSKAFNEYDADFEVVSFHHIDDRFGSS